MSTRSHTTRRRGALPVTALLVTLALLAAACGDSDSSEGTDGDEASTEADSTEDAASTSTESPSTTSSAESTTTSPAPLTASDRGVSEDTIAVGIMVPDAEQILALGVDLGWGDVQGHWEVAIGARHEAGGVLGRTLEPIFYTYLPVGSEFSDIGCVKLTQDDEVFAVFGFIRPVENALCFTELNDTPVIGTTSRLTPEVEDRSLLPALATVASPEASDRAMIAALEELGELEGRRIAVHGREASRLDLLESELDALGYDVVARTELSAPEEDSLALDSELDVIVSRWITEDVDLVLNVTTSIALLGALNRAGFAVDMVTTETDVTLDDRDGRGGTEEEFRRVRVVGPVGPGTLVEDGHEPSVECRERWNTERPDEAAPTFPGEGELQNLGLVLTACAAVDVFAELATIAGPELTHENFDAALESVGELELAGHFAASLGPDKWSSPDLDVVSILGWDDEEGAFRAVGEPVAVG